MLLRREARCSCSWKALSSSAREVTGVPAMTLRDLVPGRIRRVAAEGGKGFPVLEGTGTDGGIWTSVNGGGDGRRGDVVGGAVAVSITCAGRVWYCLYLFGGGAAVTF